MEKLSEREIIQKIKNGEVDYFAFLVKKYSPIVYYYVWQKVKNGNDVQDIIQNSFIKVYKAIDHFDSRKKFYPYFFSIVKNEMAQFYRDNLRHQRLNEEILAQNQLMEENEDFHFLIKNLKREHKAVLKFYYLEGYSYYDIAQKLEKPINTIKTLLRRAKIEVKKTL